MHTNTTIENNAFTIDVEDYFHVQAFADRIDRSQWDHFESRVVPNTRKILRLLESHQVVGTFFILGWVADKHPELVREIQRAGHEIGCHSYWHRLIYEQTPEEFRDDLRQSTDVLQQITGEKIVAFRAPCFSITQQSKWAIDILIEQGYRLDSSIVPVRHDTYGFRNADPAFHTIERPAGSLLETPPAVRCTRFANLPVGGGGYFRILPYRMIRRGLRGIHAKEHRPFVFYIHPWELDPNQPRLPARLKSRLRHYTNLRTTERKLDRLLGDFRFAPLLKSTGVQSTTPTSLKDTALDIDATQFAVDTIPIEQPAEIVS